MNSFCEKAGLDKASCYKADISNSSELEQAVEHIANDYGQIDAVVNSAGICSNVSFLSMTNDAYEKIVRVNQFGTFYCMKYSARKMIQLGTQGVIVNVSSVFQEVVSPGVIHYHASKAAVSTMTKAAALELAPYGIRVVGVAPGIIDTPMVQRDKELNIWDELQVKHMRGKALQPEHVASVILFLCSDAAAGINASIIPIEDGLLSKF
jgi:NAD(P)-dependent dehydrogenase (short-subunit alcohol dehydrogenase family)